MELRDTRFFLPVYFFYIQALWTVSGVGRAMVVATKIKGLFSSLLAWIHQTIKTWICLISEFLLLMTFVSQLTSMNIMQLCDMQALKFTSKPSFLNYNKSEVSSIAITASAVTIKCKQLLCWIQNEKKNIMFFCTYFDTTSIKCSILWQKISRQLITTMAILSALERCWWVGFLEEKEVKTGNHYTSTIHLLGFMYKTETYWARKRETNLIHCAV